MWKGVNPQRNRSSEEERNSNSSFVCCYDVMWEVKIITRCSETWIIWQCMWYGTQERMTAVSIVVVTVAPCRLQHLRHLHLTCHLQTFLNSSYATWFSKVTKWCFIPTGEIPRKKCTCNCVSAVGGVENDFVTCDNL